MYLWTPKMINKRDFISGLGQVRTSTSRRYPRVKTIDFEEGTEEEIYAVPKEIIGGRGESAGEREVEAALNHLGRLLGMYWDNFHAGLNNFETAMSFASDQETRPRYFDVALKEVGKFLLEGAINRAFEAHPLIAAVANSIKSIVTVWRDEAERASRAQGERRIADYIAEIRNQAGTQSGPQLRMLQMLHALRPRILDDYRAAVQRSALPAQQGRRGFLTGEAATLVRELRNSLARFQGAMPPAALFAQLFTERFAGSQAWTGLISHGGRRGGTLYLVVDVYPNAWRVKSVEPAWTLATTAPKPERLATSLATALYHQNKKVWQTNLPKTVELRIGSREGFVNFIDDPAHPVIRSNYGRDQFHRAWNVPEIRQSALNVNQLRGSSR